ncbi:MAG TPA: hypothetical protein VFP93_00995 [Gammaproteobacteria bacterium]|nr:hypothetical protein [Gammaproteobacteria bacterium]
MTTPIGNLGQKALNYMPSLEHLQFMKKSLDEDNVKPDGWFFSDLL